MLKTIEIDGECQQNERNLRHFGAELRESNWLMEADVPAFVALLQLC